MAANERRLWYLSYGSNMNPLVLTERRKVYPVESIPCSVPGYSLNFDCQGIPYFEPAFASIERVRKSCEGQRVTLHGVIHNITRAEMLAIRLSEGGNGHDGLGYDVHEVEVLTYSGQKIFASTLVYQGVGDWAAYPSRRYMNLILEGARVSQLDRTYIAYLESLPIYERKTFSQTIASCLCGYLTVLLFLPIFLLIGCYRLWTHKRPPRVSIVTLNLARNFIYLFHDCLLRPFLGSGYR
jgi:hypothetical protein